MKDLGQRLFDLEARIEGIFPLALGDSESPPEWFEDFCDYADGASESAFRAVPKLRAFAGEVANPEDVASAIVNSDVSGFACKIEWCQRKYQTATLYISGWGFTRFGWFYGDTPEAAIENALAAVEENHSVARNAVDT